MIAFRSIGGTGNRMFIYAAASALKNQGKFTCISSFNNLNYFKISVIEKLWNSFKWYFILVIRKFRLVKLFDFKNGWEDHSSTLSNLKENAIATGYFQGKHYFENYQKEIRQKFEIKKQFHQLYTDFIAPYKNRKIAAVQIRRTDYLQFNDPDLLGPDLTLPLSYYMNLIDQLRKEDTFQFIVMSDDKQYLIDHFKGQPDIVISENEEIVDLQILIHADICIISPSSFGWWGAWLNEKIEKKVFVPDCYLGFKVNKEYPFGIIPDGWNKVKI
jgi:hypothetical protein